MSLKQGLVEFDRVNVLDPVSNAPAEAIMQQMAAIELKPLLVSNADRLHEYIPGAAGVMHQR